MMIERWAAGESGARVLGMPLAAGQGAWGPPSYLAWEVQAESTQILFSSALSPPLPLSCKVGYTLEVSMFLTVSTEVSEMLKIS